jgi:hypothetical protein
VTDSSTFERQRAAAIAARGEQIKTNSAEYLWICCGIRPALPPPDKAIVIDRNNPPGPEAFETAMRKDSEQLQLRVRTKLR